MEAKTYNISYSEALAAVKSQRKMMAGMVIALIILAIMAFNQRERIVLVPPNMDAKLEVSYGGANDDYYKRWSLYVATFLGNLNPGNSSFVKEALGEMFSPALYADLQKQLLDQAERMRTTGRSLNFYPNQVIYEKKSGKTFVTGEQEVISSTGNKTQQDVVYEFVVKINHGMPEVTQYVFYQGQPRTLDWLSRHSTAVTSN